eukprot:TRINITY_DN10777_c0_g1_i1.p1 TRINITY_DN10777_c0_g1~~TRINITY_DN10777_c0_g1_i1.p1  ORF type:complete len:259 (+),score=39.09 TRINITY_DN10777_c0_g1_i1:43-819(+)
MIANARAIPSTGPSGYGSLPSTPAFEERVSEVLGEYCVKNTFIDVPPAEVFPRSHSWSSGQPDDSSSGSRKDFSLHERSNLSRDLSNSSSVSAADGEGDAKVRSATSRSEARSTQPPTKGGRCIYCKKDHEASARPNKQRRLNLKTLLQDIESMPDDAERDLAFSRFLKHGPFACKLMTLFCPDLDMQKIASLNVSDDEEDEPLGSPREPGVFHVASAAKAGRPAPQAASQNPSKPSKLAAPLTPGQVGAGSSTKLSL